MSTVRQRRVSAQHDQSDTSSPEKGSRRSLDVDDSEHDPLQEKRHEQEQDWPYRSWLTPVWLHVLGAPMAFTWLFISLPIWWLLRLFGKVAPAPTEIGLATGEYRDTVRGKVVLVTGASAGIGLKTAETLAAMGATVVIGVRSRAKGQAAVEGMNARLQTEWSSAPYASEGRVILGETLVDLADMSSVVAFARYVKETFPRLDILVLNAGMGGCRGVKNPDGLDFVMCANYLGHYLLTQLLLPTLRQGKNRRHPGRVVCLSSMMHNYTQYDIQHTLLHGEHRMTFLETLGKVWDPYPVSKLAMLIHSHYVNLQAQDGDVLSVAVNPGATYSDIWRFLPQVFQDYFLNPMMKAIFLTPQQGAFPSLACCVLPPASLTPPADKDGHTGIAYVSPYWIPGNTLLPFDALGPFVGWQVRRSRVEPTLATPIATALSQLAYDVTRKYQEGEVGLEKESSLNTQ